eukprot:Phypoly_transcript_22697.p1 GENE.Phypoly_transcript_22697~~Phypoly_transcript_22697.p1  ORF type:complete len:101 (+),score=9.25 Phypoly_transcript_22697:268-570(+)
MTTKVYKIVILTLKGTGPANWRFYGIFRNGARRDFLLFLATGDSQGFLLSSSKSEQMDFLLALDGSSNLLLADRMVKLSNFLTLGRQPYNMVTAVEILEV